MAKQKHDMKPSAPLAVQYAEPEAPAPQPARKCEAVGDTFTHEGRMWKVYGMSPKNVMAATCDGAKPAMDRKFPRGSV